MFFNKPKNIDNKTSNGIVDLTEHKDGYYGILKKDFECFGMTFAGSRAISFHKKTLRVRSGFLSGDQEINGLWYKGYTLIRFHGNGNVKSGVLSKNQFVDNLKYRGGYYIYLYGDGSVRQGLLDASDGIHENHVKDDYFGNFTWIRFNLDNSVHSNSRYFDPLMQG